MFSIRFMWDATDYPYMRDIVEDPTIPGRGCMLDGQKVSCAKVAQYARQGAIGSIGVSAPTGVIHGDGWTIGRTTDPGADNLNQGYLISLEKLGIDVGDSGEEQKEEQTEPNCYVTLGAVYAGFGAPAALHLYLVTSDPTNKTETYYSGFPGDKPIPFFRACY
jgi:hypothetical protein